MPKVTKVQISENYEAVKRGIKRIGEKSVECKGSWKIRQDRFGQSYINFYAKTVLDDVPKEVKKKSELNYFNDSDSLTDYYVVDRIRVDRYNSEKLFISLVNISSQG